MKEISGKKRHVLEQVIKSGVILKSLRSAIIHVLSNSQSTPGHLLIWKKVNDHRLFAVVIHFNTTFFPKS